MDSSKEKTIFIGNLHDNVTQDLLEEIFIQMGPINNVKIVKKSGERMAFIEFEHEESVLFTCRMMEGLKFYGKVVKISPRLGSQNDREWFRYVAEQREKERERERPSKSDRDRRYEEREASYYRTPWESFITQIQRRQIFYATPPPPPPPPLLPTPDRYSRHTPQQGRSHSAHHDSSHRSKSPQRDRTPSSSTHRSRSPQHVRKPSGSTHRSRSPQRFQIPSGFVHRSRSPQRDRRPSGPMATYFQQPPSSSNNNNGARSSKSFGTTGNLPSIFLKK